MTARLLLLALLFLLAVEVRVEHDFLEAFERLEVGEGSVQGGYLPEEGKRDGQQRQDQVADADEHRLVFV